MNHRKHGRGLAGLVIVAALAMMAFASSAQAEGKKPVFYVNGNPATGSLHIKLAASQVGTNNFLLVKALNLEIKCATFSVQAGTALLGEHVLPGKLLFEGCKAFESEPALTELTTCQVIVTEADTRTHITATGQVLPAELLNGNYGVLAEGDAVVLFLKGKGCPLPLTNLVKGEICLKLDNNHTTPLLLLSDDTIQGECRPRSALESLLEQKAGGFKDKLLYGAQTAFVDTHLNVSGEIPHGTTTLGVLLLP